MIKNKIKKQTVNINKHFKIHITDVYILLVFKILILIGVNFRKQNVYGEEMP
jgi:hypothetical protein